MKYKTDTYAIILGCLFLLPAHTSVCQVVNACIAEVIKADEIAGKARNNACEEKPLSLTIREYTTAMTKYPLKNCPGEFVQAFEEHKQAWLAILDVTDHYPHLRGEMHELFTQIQTGRDSAVFNRHLKRIWDSLGRGRSTG